MRIRVEGPPGTLAQRPEDALSVLADIAAADGADRDDWIEKAIKSGGAARRAVPVSTDPAYRVVKDVTADAVDAYAQIMVRMRSAIAERLRRAVEEADLAPYRGMIASKD